MFSFRITLSTTWPLNKVCSSGTLGTTHSIGILDPSILPVVMSYSRRYLHSTTTSGRLAKVTIRTRVLPTRRTSTVTSTRWTSQLQHGQNGGKQYSQDEAQDVCAEQGKRYTIRMRARGRRAGQRLDRGQTSHAPRRIGYAELLKARLDPGGHFRRTCLAARLAPRPRRSGPAPLLSGKAGRA